jgi:hypothetical protein
MGQQNGNVARAFAARYDIFFAMRKILCVGSCLGRVAALMRCVQLDAVMHNRSSGVAANRNRFWSRTGASWLRLSLAAPLISSNNLHSKLKDIPYLFVSEWSLQCIAGIFHDRPISEDGGNNESKHGGTDEIRWRVDRANRRGEVVGDCPACERCPVGAGQTTRPQASEPFDPGECGCLDCNHFLDPPDFLLRSLPASLTLCDPLIAI